MRRTLAWMVRRDAEGDEKRCKVLSVVDNLRFWRERFLEGNF